QLPARRGLRAELAAWLGHPRADPSPDYVVVHLHRREARVRDARLPPRWDLFGPAGVHAGGGAPDRPQRSPRRRGRAHLSVPVPRLRPERLTESFDAVVVGAGPAGSAAATVLAGSGRAVLLLEKDV